MKKNTVLYILLAFLIVVNGFFLFNYMGNSSDNNEKGRKDPMSFLKKELKFNASQLEKMKTINATHHQNMMHTNDELRDLKDRLFNTLSDASVNEKTIDSITSLIGQKQKSLEKEIYYHFKSIQELCDDKQKIKFKKIIKKALHNRGGKDHRPPPPRGPNGHRPPPNDF